MNKKKPLPAGIEPATFRLTAERSTDWATEAWRQLISHLYSYTVSQYLSRLYKCVLVVMILDAKTLLRSNKFLFLTYERVFN